MITPSSFGRLFRAAAFVALPLLATSARAELLAYDGFNHATGALAGQTGPSGFNGAYTAFGTGSNVATPGLTFPGLTVVGNKVTLSGTNVGVNAALANAPQTVGSRLYFSFLLQSVGSGSAGLSFCQGSNETLFVGSRSSYLGVDPKGGTAANTSLAPTTATMVVGRIDFAASGATIRLYVNPTSTVEPVYSRLTVAKTSALTFDGIRIWSTGTAGSFDEFRLGTTYADVAPVTVGAAAGENRCPRFLGCGRNGREHAERGVGLSFKDADGDADADRSRLRREVAGGKCLDRRRHHAEGPRAFPERSRERVPGCGHCDHRPFARK